MSLVYQQNNFVHNIDGNFNMAWICLRKQLLIGTKIVFKKDYMFRLKRNSPRYSVNM